VTIADFLIIIGRILFGMIILLSLMPLMVWVERKGAAYIQDRPGPNRAAIGPIRLGGVVHIIADALKMFSKESITPTHVEKFPYLLAPVLVTAVALMTIAVVPWADAMRFADGTVIGMQSLDLDVGLLWFLAITSVSVYGIVLAGWSSNNKYSLMGAVRSTAQMLSYELPMGLALIGTVLVYGTLHLNEIVQTQGQLLFGFLPKWGILVQPLAAIIFIICAFAETNRTPFDLAEGESELVAGFHTEYSAMKFGLFFLGEYMAIIGSAALIATLFFGGWQIPWVTTAMLVDNVAITLPVVLGLGGAGALAIGGHLVKVSRTGPKLWGDWRDKEGEIFGWPFIGIGALMLLGCFLSIGANLPTWVGPVVAAVVQFSTLMAKTAFFCWMFVWVRWTLPRFRYDQLMNLGWRSLIPLTLVNIVITGAVILGVS
jgi:NADH-quinone oxidoreductase subunit H